MARVTFAKQVLPRLYVLISSGLGKATSSAPAKDDICKELWIAPGEGSFSRN